MRAATTVRAWLSSANKGDVREILDTDKTRCHHCGATRIDAQLGLEPTPEEYHPSRLS